MLMHGDSHYWGPVHPLLCVYEERISDHQHFAEIVVMCRLSI